MSGIPLVWLFLALSVVGVSLTVNAIWPTRRLLAVSFVAGWLTSELALFALGWQAAIAVVFFASGARASWAGDSALLLTTVSSAGLVWLLATSRRAGVVMESALEAGLGEGYRSRIDAAILAGLSRGITTSEIAFPFWLRDRRLLVTRDIAYAPGAGRRRHLDIYQSRGHAKGAPVLLQIHGGAWVLGDKGAQGRPLMLHLAARGWICVAANYRLSPRATFPDHLVDCKLALRWVREHIAEYGGDPDFVVVTGGSAGGHLASLVALTANDPAYQPGFEDVDTSVAACVPMYGVYDFTDRFGFRGPRDGLAKLLARAIMKTPRAVDPDAYDRASPMSHVRADAPPFLIVHGTSDLLAPVAEARKFASMLRAVSREPVVYAEIPGAHHAFEVFSSLRAAYVIRGIARFCAWVESTRRAVHSPIGRA